MALLVLYAGAPFGMIFFAEAVGEAHRDLVFLFVACVVGLGGSFIIF